MAWQKCPVCNGTGKNFISNCPTCNGHRIISELTGKPPTYEIKTGATTNCNYYEPSSDTSSATVCKWCGKGKLEHSFLS